MKTIIKEIPEGIRYLSDWDGFNHLPKHEHYILAKEICGCGATEAFIKSNEPLIIAMPRKHLLFNKYSQHIGENIFLYRFLNQKQYFSDKTPTKADLELFDRLFIEYIVSFAPPTWSAICIIIWIGSGAACIASTLRAIWSSAGVIPT